MHERSPSLRKNFIMNVILTMSSIIFPLITFPYISRVLLPQGTGKVALAASFISYFAIFSQLGIPTYGIRACAKLRDDREQLTRTAHELLFINIVMSVAVYVILFAAIAAIPRLREESLLYVITSSTILFNTIGMEWLYKALEQYTYITVRSVVFKLIAIVLMFVTVREQKDYIVYGALSVFAAAASNVMNFFHAHKYIKMTPVGGYNVRRHFKAVLVFFAMSCATTIYTHLDTVMLGFMTSDEDVGYYNAAVKIKSVLISVVTSLGAVLLPRSSYYIQKGRKDEFLRISSKALNFVFLLSIPLMVYFIIFAKQGIYFLSGSAFGKSVLPMQIIMPTVLFIGITNIFGIQMLVPMGKEKMVLYSEIVGAVANLILNFLLIPKYLSVGAAVGTLVAEALVLVVQTLALKDVAYAMLKKTQYFKYTAAIILSCLASAWVRCTQLGNFMSLLISSLLFFGTYFIFMFAAKEPMTVQIVRQILDKLTVGGSEEAGNEK